MSAPKWRRRAQEAGPAYEAAFAEPFVDTPRLAAMYSDSRTASPFLVKHMNSAQKQIRDIEAATGQKTGRVQFWDEVKRSMDGEIGRLRNQVSKGEADPGDLIRMERVQAAMLEELPQSYAAARELGGDAPRIQSAYRQGERALSNVQNAAQLRRNLPPTDAPERAAVQAGTAADISTRARQGTMTPQRVRRQDQQEKMRTIFGEEPGQQLASRMEAEAELRDLAGRYGPRANSVTGTVLEGGPSQLVDEAIAAGAHLATGNKLALGRQLINWAPPTWLLTKADGRDR